jgi:small subunit ribosomal protein S1
LIRGEADDPASGTNIASRRRRAPETDVHRRFEVDELERHPEEGTPGGEATPPAAEAPSPGGEPVAEPPAPEAEAAAPTPAPAPEESKYKIGQRVWGPILRLTETHAVVSLSEHGLDEGTLDLIHLRDEYGNLSVAEGDEVQAYIIKLKPAIRIAPNLYPPAAEVLQGLRQAMEKGEAVRGRVTGVNRGGLEVDLQGRRAFCPYSHIEIGRCENAEIYLNRILDFRVIELEEAKRRIVLSRRAVLEKERKAKVGELRAQVREGAEFDAVVTRLQPFGAFVDIGGIEGLVHVSEISFDRLTHPSEALRRGQRVRVKVLGIQQGEDNRERIRLSIRATLEDPWSKLSEQFHQGDIVTGTVLRVTDFGAFVKLYPGIEGLLHVSQYEARGPRAPEAPAAEDAPPPAEATPVGTPQVGQELTVRISRIDAARRRISLALRDEERPQQRRAEHDAAVGEIVDGTVRAIKRFGVFVDLPSLGPWVSGLLPEAETGLGRGVNLTRHYKPGDPLRVEIIEIDDQGRIRLSVKSIQEREERAASGGTGAEGAAGAPAQPAALNPIAEAFKRAQEREKEEGA